MTNTSLKIFIVLCLLYLSACSATNSTNTFTPVAAENDQVVVYIYRPSAMSNAIYSPDLYLNNEFRLSIKNGKKTRLILKPGEYKFELEPDKNHTGTTFLSLNLNAGTTYYFRVDTTLKLINATNYEPYERRFDLINVDKKLAKNQIAECCMSRSDTAADKSKIKEIEKVPNEGFSVDKTQNPFSH